MAASCDRCDFFFVIANGVWMAIGDTTDGPLAGYDHVRGYTA